MHVIQLKLKVFIHSVWLQQGFIAKTCENLWAIWKHLDNLKNVKNSHGRATLLVKLQAKASNFTKKHFSMGVFHVNVFHLISCFFKIRTNSTKSCKAIHLLRLQLRFWVVEDPEDPVSFPIFDPWSDIWSMPKYGVVSGPYFPVFGLNTEIYGVIGHSSRGVIPEVWT